MYCTTNLSTHVCPSVKTMRWLDVSGVCDLHPRFYGTDLQLRNRHSFHNATMEEGSLLHKPTNYYYGPNLLSGFNVLLKC